MKLNIKKKVLSLILLCAMAAGTLSGTAPGMGQVQAAGGTTYYFSSKNGKDTNTGTAQDSPWYSLQKIGDLNLEPGDQVLLESGSVFDGYIHLKEVSGTEEAPILISSYGEGNAPRIDTKGQGIWYQNYGKSLDNSRHKKEGYVSSSILLYDTEYIEISGIEVTNHGIDGENYSDANKMNRTGVAVVAQNKGTLDHIHLKNLNVHDVNGNVADKHMNNGGIYFTVFQPENEALTGISRYNDILIEGCTVQNTSRWGIAAAYTAYWNHFTSTAIPDEAAQEYGMTNVVIQNNYIKDVGGDAITTMYCYRPLIQYNVSDGAAKEMNEEVYPGDFGRVAAGIWPWKCKDAVFQYNEVFDMVYNQDAQAWDADSGDGTIYQYNYSHNNAGGSVMFCLQEAYRNTFRYNISQGDLGGIINAPSNPDAEIYNNTFYVPEGVDFIRSGMTGGSMNVRNNIIYYAGSEPKEEEWTKGNTKAVYSNNLYYNYANAPENDTLAITEDPQFTNPGSAPKTAQAKVHGNAGGAFDGYKLKETSPALNAATLITDNGGKDFFGNEISGIPDIGAFESNSHSLKLLSSVYKIEDLKIQGVEKDTAKAEFLGNLLYEAENVTVNDTDGNPLADGDIVRSGCRVVLTTGAQSAEYQVVPNTDNQIKASSYMINEDKKEIAVPATEKNPTTVREVKKGFEIHNTASIEVRDGERVLALSDKIVNGMKLVIIAEDGTENSYTIVVKNTYHWSEDYVYGQQGNVWFSQKKAEGSYSNLTQLDSWPDWMGASYACVGVDGAEGTQTGTRDMHGLLCDSLNESSRQQGHSMAFRVPKTGTMILNFNEGEPYLRQASASNPNEGGNVTLTITKNGIPVSETYTLKNDKTPVTIPAVTVTAEKGDYIRVEALNQGNPNRPSIHVTPIITYQDVKAEDTIAPEDPVVPQAPAGTEIGADYIILKWLPSDDNIAVAGYRIYNGNNPGELLKDITVAELEGVPALLAREVFLGYTYKLEGLKAGTGYELYLTAYDEAGNESEKALAASIQTKTEEDKSVLKACLDAIKKLRDNGAADALNSEERAQFDNAIANGEAVLGNINAVREEIDKAALDILNAMALVDKADKEVLKAAIDLADRIQLENYVDKGKQEFEAARKSAHQVWEKENATREEIKQAVKTLLETMGNLKEKADKEALRTLVTEYSQLSLKDYTEESVKKFQDVLQQAEQMLKEENLSKDQQNQVNDMVKKLADARNGLEKIQTGGNPNGGNDQNNNNPNGGNDQNNPNGGNDQNNNNPNGGNNQNNNNPNGGNNQNNNSNQNNSNPDNQSNSNQNSMKTPVKSGDYTNLTSWLLLLMLSCAVIVQARSKAMRRR